jgi:hypothetical protein
MVDKDMRVIMDDRARRKIAKQQREDEIRDVMEDFAQAYCFQKDLDLDEIELVVYDEGKKTVMYFREKSDEVRQYGPDTKQS